MKKDITHFNRYNLGTAYTREFYIIYIWREIRKRKTIHYIDIINRATTTIIQHPDRFIIHTSPNKS